MRLAFSVARVSSVSSRSCVQRLQFSCSCVERFSVARVSSVFQLLVCRAFLTCSCVERFRCSCVERFQLLVCRAFLTFSSCVGVFSCSCVEHFHSLVCRAFSVLVCRTFSVARVSCVFVTPLFAVALDWPKTPLICAVYKFCLLLIPGYLVVSFRSFLFSRCYFLPLCITGYLKFVLFCTVLVWSLCITGF